MNGPLLLFMLLVTAAFCGCASTATPNLEHPGTARTQQSRALRYDPYPENEPGPALVGVRPREYDKPPPESSQARWFLGRWGQ
jgi:hypothetical protein